MAKQELKIRLGSQMCNKVLGARVVWRAHGLAKTNDQVKL